VGEQAGERLDGADLGVMNRPLGFRCQSSLQTASETTFDHTGINAAVVGSERLQGVEALQVRPQLECNAEASELALPGLGQALVGAIRTPRGQHDAPGRAGLDDDDGEPQRENDANERTANYDQKLSHAPA